MRILIVFLALVIGSPVVAQHVACGPRASILAQVTGQYGEILQAVASTSATVVIEFFANPETGTWTVVTTGPDGISCAPGSGRDWQAVDPILPDRPPNL